MSAASAIVIQLITGLIEAAACGCPVVMGPSTFNFADAAELSEQAGAAQRRIRSPEAILAAKVRQTGIHAQPRAGGDQQAVRLLDQDCASGKAFPEIVSI